jgi:hypothetical protein
MIALSGIVGCARSSLSVTLKHWFAGDGSSGLAANPANEGAVGSEAPVVTTLCNINGVAASARSVTTESPAAT